MTFGYLSRDRRKDRELQTPETWHTQQRSPARHIGSNRRPGPVSQARQRHPRRTAVVGGGITGLTAAYLLAAAGKSVALLERGRCAQAETGHTTAH